MFLLLLCSTALSAQSLEGRSVEFGVHTGIVLRDAQDPVGSGWLVAPRFSFWPAPRWALELEAGLARAPLRDDSGRMGLFRPALGVAYDPLVLGPNPRVRPVATLGLGLDVDTTASARRGSSTERRLAVQPEAGFGVVVVLLGALQLRTDLKLALDAGPHDEPVYAHASWTAGITTRLSITRDRDNDFVPDNIDACPAQPEDLDGFEDDDGCPDRDNDQDGVRDALDSCDDQPEDIDGVDDEDGCPETS